MGSFTPVIKAKNISEGSVKSVIIEGKKIAVANINGNFYAFADECSHRQCSLSDGFLAGSQIICPCHGAGFDVVSGRVLNGPATEPIKTYAVKTAGENILVEI